MKPGMGPEGAAALAAALAGRAKSPVATRGVTAGAGDEVSIVSGEASPKPSK